MCVCAVCVVWFSFLFLISVVAGWTPEGKKIAGGKYLLLNSAKSFPKTISLQVLQPVNLNFDVEIIGTDFLFFSCVWFHFILLVGVGWWWWRFVHNTEPLLCWKSYSGTCSGFF